MWERLRDNKIGFKFRREHPVGSYRLDFFCREAMLAVEMDGDQHDPERDAPRDAALAELAILVYRVPNVEYLMIGDSRTTDHLAAITKLCEERSGRKAFPGSPLTP